MKLHPEQVKNEKEIFKVMKFPRKIKLIQNVDKQITEAEKNSIITKARSRQIIKKHDQQVNEQTNKQTEREFCEKMESVRGGYITSYNEAN